MTDVSVTDNTDAARFEVRVDGALAGFADYRLREHGTVVAVMHTEIDDAFAGEGLAKQLAVAVLDGLRADGRSLLPFCPFFRGYVAKHPEYADLVPEGRRAEFGL